MHRIALGVAPTNRRGDYALAVRPQRSGPLMSALIDEIRREAHNEIDVQYIGSIVKLAKKGARLSEVTRPEYYRSVRRPLRIGSSISDASRRVHSAGTLGCFVSARTSPYYLALLTNNHVIAGENHNPAGTPVLQPGSLDGGRRSTGVIGELGPFVKLQDHRPNEIDAALGWLYEGVAYDPQPIGEMGALAGLADEMALETKPTVYKVGRTTGQTKGKVTAFELEGLTVEFDRGVLTFDDQIEIEGDGRHAFSDSGDSGSLIVDQECRAVGLLFAGGDEGGSNGKGLTYANPIRKVLDELKVDLVL